MCRVMSGDVDILKQILNKAEYDMKDYTDSGWCYPLRPKARIDNMLRDLDNCYAYVPLGLPKSFIVVAVSSRRGISKL